MKEILKRKKKGMLSDIRYLSCVTKNHFKLTEIYKICHLNVLKDKNVLKYFCLKVVLVHEKAK